MYVGQDCRSDLLVAEGALATYTTHSKRKKRTYVPLSKFAASVPKIERPQTYTLDHTTTGICQSRLSRFCFVEHDVVPLWLGLSWGEHTRYTVRNRCLSSGLPSSGTVPRILHAYHPARFDQPHNPGRRERFMEILNKQDSSPSLSFFPQHPVHKCHNLLAPELFFLTSAHPVYKMWTIQEPNTL